MACQMGSRAPHQVSPYSVGEKQVHRKKEPM
jgi:hypothetical protein